jgi:hypothetical protein
MSDETNVDVTTPTNTDGNYHSFDDLEQSLDDGRSDTELVKEAQKVAKEERSEPATKEDIKEALSEASKEDKFSEKSKEENIEDAGEQAVEEIVEEIRKLKARFGEEEYELPEDATFLAKVDGEEIEVSLKDLKTNYSGKVAWDKKFSELGAEKKAYMEDKQVVESYIAEFKDYADKGDFSGAMEFLARLAGHSPLEFRKQLREQIINNHKAMLEMTEEQKQAYELSEENEFLKRQQESAKAMTEEQQTVLELQSQIKSFQEAHNVSDEELLAAYDNLQANYEGQIELSTIQEYVSTSRAYQKTEEALSPIVSEVSDDLLIEVADVVVENPEFTVEDIQDIVKEAYPELVSSNSKKGVAKKAKEGAKKAAQEKAEEGSYQERLARNKLEEFYSFDDLD